MKPSLQLKLSQHLALTPQLQQSIKLLQLSTLELNAEVERILQENPLLEKDESEAEEEAAAAAAESQQRERVAEAEFETRTSSASGDDEADEDAPLQFAY